MLLNTTFFVEDANCVSFVSWLRKRVPEIDDKFSPEIYRIVAQQEPGVKSFALQVKCTSDELKQEWESSHFPVLCQQLKMAFGEKVMLFTSELKNL